MKIQFLRIFTFAFVLISLVSCSSDDNNNTNTETSFIRAQIGDVTWESSETITSSVIQVGQLGKRFDLTAQNDDIRITLASEQTTVGGECMNLVSYSGDNILTILWYAVGDGTYAGLYDETPWLGDPSEQNFVITITSCENGLISGTFSGTQFISGGSNSNYPDTVEITNGEFQNVPYTFTLIED